ncbi:MAG: aldehyde dehydrogenase (NADP(+)) [Cyclobacteriaceae bacterium]|nr:aldehyde dehydrogenase (NADP(+)) [Cyclobacteriaceae bacterium]
MFKDIGDKEIDKILQQSQQAFLKYRRVSGLSKSVFLEVIASEIEALGEALIRTAMEETNLPQARLEGERARTCNQLRQFSALVKEGSWVDARVDTAVPDRTPLPKPDIRKMMVPLGTVVVFGASNFPFAYSTAGVDTASALAAGCPVVLKAHPAHPGTSELVAEAILNAASKTGMPEYTFQHIHSSNFESGRILVQHSITKAVGFTGSFSGGKALYDYAAQRPDPIPVFSEMGSINPVFILPKSLKVRSEKVAEMYAASITQSVGQFCTNPGIMFSVDNPDLEKFAKQLGDKMKEIAPATMLHPGIAASFKKNREKALTQKGVSLIAESNQKPKENQGVSTLSTVHAKDFLNNPVLEEEVFGPYSLLVKASSIEELTEAVHKLPGQLTATIIGEEDDLIEYAEFIQLVVEKAGRIIINGVPTGVEVCPSMHHGGPFPATTDSRFTSVGIDAIKRFVRPVSFQNFPDVLLPDELKYSNPLHIWRLVNNELMK